MAKKRKLRPERPGKGRKGRPDDLLAAGLPDPRTAEAILRQMLGGAGSVSADSPTGKAQSLLDRAYVEQDAGKRAELARQALQVWPDCADACVLLAENASTQKEALPLYEQAVAAGERALGPEVFNQQVGNFWLVLETRPYMRARQGLAFILWTTGRREEAVGHVQEMLRLNPNDNQGLRYSLAAWYLNLDRDEDLAQLLQRYDEDSTTWLYTRASSARSSCRLNRRTVTFPASRARRSSMRAPSSPRGETPTALSPGCGRQRRARERNGKRSRALSARCRSSSSDCASCPSVPTSGR
jgi:tetratricopeptide (TPR) repeat protein